MTALNTDLEFGQPSLNFYTGCQKVQNLALTRCGFETKQRIAYLFQVGCPTITDNSL